MPPIKPIHIIVFANVVGFVAYLASLNILQAGTVVAAALAESLDKPFAWAVGFFFGNTELSLELWNVIAGLSGFDDS